MNGEKDWNDHPPLHVSNLFNVNGSVAIVTGGGTGIGQIIARTLASNGAKVYITSRRIDTLEECVKSYEAELHPSSSRSGSGKMIAISADLSSKAGIEDLKRRIEELEPSLDILVNNAGIMQSSPLTEPKTIENISETMWSVEETDAEKIYKTNVLGPYYLSAALLPILGRSKSNPQIINISSVSSFMRSGSNTGLIYPMSKAAVNHLTKILATELGGLVRCNAICPGLFNSQMSHRLQSEPSLFSRIMSNIPAGRAGTEQEMAAAILFLTSQQQSYVNGAIIPLDGGIMSINPCTY